MNEIHKSERHRIKWLWLALIFSAIALFILISLGNWQVRRLAEKETLLATIDARVDDAPLPLDDVIALEKAGENIEYMPVEAMGYFEHQYEAHFFATFEGMSGYYIYTPLRLLDGRRVFVNRGFVPFDKKEAATRPESLVSLSQDVTGLARSAPTKKAGWVVPDNDLEKNIYYWKDIRAMIAQTGLPQDDFVPLFIDQDNKANPSQLPVGGVTLIDLPNNHLQYLLTWYGLALTLVGVLGFYIFSNWKKIRPKE